MPGGALRVPRGPRVPPHPTLPHLEATHLCDEAARSRRRTLKGPVALRLPGLPGKGIFVLSVREVAAARPACHARLKLRRSTPEGQRWGGTHSSGWRVTISLPS